jgi:hypothetical protein
VESDKKWIGWTTGDTQAERYKLSKQVDSIIVILDGENTYALTEYKDGQSRINKEKIPEPKLSEFIGKELAAQSIEKIKSSPQPSLASAEFEGLDLDVGGEGMKGFYDQILPKEVGKYIAKMGGKVEKSEIAKSTQENIEKKAEELARENGILPDEESLEWLTGRDRNRFIEEAEQELNLKPTPIWRVNITPEMAGKVRGGQLQFMPADREYDPNYDFFFQEEKKKTGRAPPHLVGRVHLPRWASVRSCDEDRPTQAAVVSIARAPAMRSGSVEIEE